MCGLSDAAWINRHDAEVTFPTIDGRGTDHILIRGRELRLRSDLGLGNICIFDFSADDFIAAIEGALHGSTSAVQVELPQINSQHEVDVFAQQRAGKTRIIVRTVPNGTAKTRLSGKVLDLSVQKAKEIIRSYRLVSSIS